MTGEDLRFTITDAIVEQLMMLCPIMVLRNRETLVFVNLSELVYVPGALDFLLYPNDAPSRDDEVSEIRDKIHSARKYSGQPSLVQRFPNILDVTTEFIKQHSFSAQHRRRTDTCFSSGITISQICEHLIQNIPGLKEHGISNSTVRRLFEPPNEGRNASVRYKACVKARVGIKNNTYREYHEDAHYLFARNKLRRELATLFESQILIISTDDMAKLKVGAPAVSSYHQLKRIYASIDAPNLPDHDFPTPGYLLNSSGNMFLEGKEPELDATMKQFNSVGCKEIESEPIAETKCDNILDALNMNVEEGENGLFPVIVRQLLIHMRIETTEMEIKECVSREIQDHITYYNEKFPSLDFVDDAQLEYADLQKTRSILTSLSRVPFTTRLCWYLYQPTAPQ